MINLRVYASIQLVLHLLTSQELRMRNSFVASIVDGPMPHR